MLEGVAALLFAACNLFAGTDAGVLEVFESVALVPQPTRRSTKKPKVNRMSHFIDWLNTSLRRPLHGFCRNMTEPFTWKGTIRRNESPAARGSCGVNTSESKAHP